jgi:catechol 2,3-dioxygenase-like lactoylglutathione lyase family enzyme
MTVPVINHIILTVSDIQKSRQFYGGLLGFEIQDIPPEYGNLVYFPVQGGAVWLLTHNQTPPADRFSEFRIGLDHLAFTAPNKAFLDELAGKLKAAGVPTNGVELFHGQWYYVAFRDPDNIQLEYWCDERVDSPSEGE